jgi:cellulose synthase/poly-beta-1,6-N-acetylglucosamine synthase-like glycosyltransferase
MIFAAFLAAMAAAICLMLAAHPFMTYPLTLRMLARLRPRPVVAGAGHIVPRVAVCVCAYNEEPVIDQRVRNILAMRGRLPALEILVYVDGATDDTAGILHGFGNSITCVVSAARMGKTHGMNTLVGMARADILVFTDANVAFAPDAVERLIAPFADPAVGCVCGHLRYAAGEGGTAATGSLYWRLEEHIKALESATGSVMGADGSIFAIRRALHVAPPADLIDDMYVSLSVLCRGARVVRAADAYAYEASVSTPQEEFQRKIRIACQAFNVHRALWPSLRRLPGVELYKYISHKLLRWFCIYLLMAAALLCAVALLVAGAAKILAAFVLLAAAIGATCGLAHHGPAARLRDVLAAIAATGLGVAQSIRGERFQIWTPPASARSLPGSGT